MRRPLTRSWLYFVLTLASLSIFMLAAQTTYTPEQGDKFIRDQNWPEAAAAYDQLTRADASNGRYWLRLGVSRLKLHQYDAALPALEHADQLAFFPARTRF